MYLSGNQAARFHRHGPYVDVERRDILSNLQAITESWRLIDKWLLVAVLPKPESVRWRIRRLE